MKSTLTILGVPDEPKQVEIDHDQDLLTALRDQGVYVKSGCGGHASCNDCLIKVKDGSENLNAPSFEEMQLLGNVFHITKERLACQTKIEGPVTIDLSKHDKDADGVKLSKKSNKFLKPRTKVRTKSDVAEISKERMQAREEKKVSQDEWENHWQKEQDPSKAKRLGGGKRPKTFRTDHLDEVESVDDTESKKEP
jgi:ferredoxin